MPPHILIIDSDASAAQITRAGVERIVPEATLAVEPDPEQGWLSVQRHCPDVMIIDPPQHPLTAGRLIQHLKLICPAAQVIVLASEPTPALRRTLQRSGADAYLAKPVPLAILMQAVHQAIETIRGRTEEEIPGAAAA